jgi:hypothetical protein
VLDIQFLTSPSSHPCWCWHYNISPRGSTSLQILPSLQNETPFILPTSFSFENQVPLFHNITTTVTRRNWIDQVSIFPTHIPFDYLGKDRLATELTGSFHWLTLFSHSFRSILLAILFLDSPSTLCHSFILPVKRQSNKLAYHMALFLVLQLPLPRSFWFLYLQRFRYVINTFRWLQQFIEINLPFLR